MIIRRTFTALFSIVALFTLFAGILSAHHGRAGYDTKGQAVFPGRAQPRLLASGSLQVTCLISWRFPFLCNG